MSTRTSITKSDEVDSFAEYKAVENALQFYIDGAKAGDGSIGRPAFFDHAHVTGTVGGEYSNPDADAFAGAVTSLGASPDIQSHIAWIDLSGPAAAAKVEFLNWSGFRFTDYFILFKKDGEWKISGKVYNSHSNN